MEARPRPAWLASLAIHALVLAAIGGWLAYHRLDRESAPPSPMPITLSMFQPPQVAQQEPVREEPVKEEPVKEEPVKEEPVKEEPVKEEPLPRAKPKPAPQPVKSSTPSLPAPPARAEPVARPVEALPTTQAQEPVPAALVAPEPAPKAPDPALEADYRNRIRLAVDGHKHYPRMARRLGLEGRVVLGFTILADGRLAGLRVVQSSGSELLDEAALEAVREAAPFPPFPRDLARERWDFTLPLDFNLS